MLRKTKYKRLWFFKAGRDLVKCSRIGECGFFYGFTATAVACKFYNFDRSYAGRRSKSTSEVGISEQ